MRPQLAAQSRLIKRERLKQLLHLNHVASVTVKHLRAQVLGLVLGQGDFKMIKHIHVLCQLHRPAAVNVGPFFHYIILNFGTLSSESLIHL